MREKPYATSKCVLHLIGILSEQSGRTGKLVGCVLVYVEYIERAPNSNPSLTHRRKYVGIGAALLAFGIQLSIDYGYGRFDLLESKDL